MNLQFLHPWVLFALWLAPALAVLWWAMFRRGDLAATRLFSPAMREKLCPRPDAWRFYWQGALLLAAAILGIVAAARPQWGMREERVIERGRDLVIAVDVSRSMLAQDVRPSRLLRAKFDVQDLLRELRGDRAALLAFRGHAVQLCPLTTDYAYLEQALNDLSIDSAPRGETDLGDAIIKALDAFESDEGSHKAIILISDGEDLAGRAKAAAEKAKAAGIVMFTVGLGDPQGAKVPDDAKPGSTLSYKGEEVVSKLQNDTLRDLADITGGAYVPVGVANVKLGSLYRDHLSRIAARDIEESIQRRYIDRYQWFLLPAVLCLLAAGALSRGRLAGKKRMKDEGGGMKGEDGGKRSEGRGQKSEVRGQRSEVRWQRAEGRKQKSAGVGRGIAGAVASVMLFAVIGGPAGADTNGPLQAATPTNAVGRPDSTALVAATNQPAKPALVVPPGKDGARMAQRLYLLGKYREASEAYAQAAKGANLDLQNDILFNAACALYKAGDYQQAADRFAEVGLRDHADRFAAAFNQGCALHELSEQPALVESNKTARAGTLERAGLMFQKALRANPDSTAARANLAVVTNTLPDIREQARLQTLMQRYGQTPPFQVAEELLQKQRDIARQLTPALTNTGPDKIGQLEALAAQQRQNADLLIPLRAGLAAALSGGKAQAPGAAPAPTPDPQQVAQVNQHLDAIGNGMQQAAARLRDLDPAAFHDVMKSEAGAYLLWKSMAPFAPLLREGIQRQTNAIDLTTSAMPDPDGEARKAIEHQQKEVLDLTLLFTNRFTQAIPPEGQPAQPAPTPAPGDTNAPAPPSDEDRITAEKRANILDLAAKATDAQTRALAAMTATNWPLSLTEQRNSYNLLKAIEELLPKNKNQQQQNQQQQQQQNQDKQQQNQQQNDQKSQQPDQDKNQPPPPTPTPQGQPEPTPEAKEQNQQKKQDKEMTPEQARAILEKALQREKDRKQEKMCREYTPPSPVEKDW